ncbi:hypothetical protein Tco_0281956 [Tanacetum coccineum]
MTSGGYRGGDGGACKVLGWLLGDVMVMQGLDELEAEIEELEGAEFMFDMMFMFAARVLLGESGYLEIGSVREVNVRSGLPSTTSTIMFKLFNEELTPAALGVLTTQPACHSSLISCLSSLGESLPSVPAIAVPDVPGYESRVHTHDYDRSEAPDGSPDSIQSSEPKPLEKHRPPPPPSILSPRESSYPP